MKNATHRAAHPETAGHGNEQIVQVHQDRQHVGVHEGHLDANLHLQLGLVVVRSTLQDVLHDDCHHHIHDHKGGESDEAEEEHAHEDVVRGVGESRLQSIPISRISFSLNRL